MLRQIDVLANSNALRIMAPEHRLAFAAALFALGFLAPVSVQLLMVVWMVRWVSGHARIPLGLYLRLLVLPFGFLLLSLPALVVGISGVDQLPALEADVIQALRTGPVVLYLSRQGLEQGIGVLSRSMALSSCLLFVLLTVPMLEITRVLERCGCPALLTELMGLMYRFVFVLADTGATLFTAQQSRLGYGTWRSSMRSLGLLVAQLLQRTLHTYRQLVLGLASRGYTGTIRLWHRRRYTAVPRYRNEAIAGGAILCVLTALHHLSGAAVS